MPIAHRTVSISRSSLVYTLTGLAALPGLYWSLMLAAWIVGTFF
jgi:hypothetical protein